MGILWPKVSHPREKERGQRHWESTVKKDGVKIILLIKQQTKHTEIHKIGLMSAVLSVIIIWEKGPQSVITCCDSLK